MPNVIIVSDTPHWCFAQRAGALERYAPDDLAITTVTGCSRTLDRIPFCRYDLIVTMRPDLAGKIRGLLGESRIPLLGCYNSGAGRVGHSLADAMVACDYVVVNNYAAWAEWKGRCRDFNACNISNGVDLRVFRPSVPIAERPNSILWTASKDKAEGEADVKGYQLIARQLQRTLPAKQIGADVRIVDDGGLDAAGMAHWYNTGSVYVVTSQSEGTPNVMLEAMACGCAVVTSDVGNVPELIDHGLSGLVVRDRQTIPFVEAIQEAIARKEELAAGALTAISSWDWGTRARWYYAVMRKLIAGEPIRPFTYLETEPGDV